MTKWTGRRSRKTARTVELETASDIFDQPEKSLLGEAFGRPLGIVALLVLIGALGALGGNHFVWNMDRINDFAMVAFFVAGGILLSLLLRSGEPRPAMTKVKRTNRQPDLVLEDDFDAPESETLSHRRQGLAEASAASAPVPKAATAVPPHAVVSPEQDDEVAGYERALRHYVARGDLHGQGEILRRLGHTAKTRGHLGESKEFYVNSRNCFKETNDHYAEAAVLLDLGQVLESLGDHDAASAAYRDANRALLDVAMNASSHRDGGTYNAQAAD